MQIIYDGGIKLLMCLAERKLLMRKRNQFWSVDVANLKEWGDDIIKYIPIGNKELKLYSAYSMMCDHLWPSLANTLLYLPWVTDILNGIHTDDLTLTVMSCVDNIAQMFENFYSVDSGKDPCISLWLWLKLVRILFTKRSNAH